MMKSLALPGESLPRINKALSAVNIVIALHIFITPFLPALSFYFHKRFGEKPPVYGGQLVTTPDKPAIQKPEGNRLVIPSILLDEPIHEGPTAATLRQGVWRRPNTATPEVASNTVLAGHLFTYTSPAVFYNLDKVNIADNLAVYWNGKEYLYEVTDKQVVPATAVQIEGPTAEARLTLYTCTPLWNPKNRLVVTASLKEVTDL